jgi:hypothetical protein
MSGVEKITSNIMDNKTEDEEVAEAIGLSAFEVNMQKCFKKLNGRIKHCARNAFQHLRRAKALSGVDDEMCAFRVLTAEEEAASALILALKQKRYPGAMRLNHRDHYQKMAITPLIRAVGEILSNIKMPFSLKVQPDSTPPRIDISVKIRNIDDESNSEWYAQPDEPLNAFLQEESPGIEGKVVDFQKQLSAITKSESLEQIVQFLEDEANFRNQLLYATDSGIPKVVLQENFFEHRKKRVLIILIITIMIMQTNQHQLLAIQTIQAFLRFIRRITPPEYDFSQHMVQNFDSIFANLDQNGSLEIYRQRKYPTKLMSGYLLLNPQKIFIDLQKCSVQIIIK